jgi:hypothetical protein
MSVSSTFRKLLVDGPHERLGEKRRWEMDRKLATLGVVAALAFATQPLRSAGVVPCNKPLPQGGDPVTLDPSDFVARVDNPYWPMAPGTRWVYREFDTKSSLRITVSVLERTKEIEGIDATVVHDVVTERGEVVENTFDWYAQDVCENVWYLGESTREYENGEVVSTAGSWKHGVDGAMAGVIMPGDPQVGLTYRQEYDAGEAEDAARIISLDEQAQPPFGHFRNVILTGESTPLEPRVLEYKLHAPGVGPVIALGISGGSDREELLRFRVPG